MKLDLFYGSCSGSRIHGCRWEPKGEPRGVVQIVHGISEHVDRFEPLALYLTSMNYVVVAEDHMGHGRSISEECPQGYFLGGWFAAVEDTRTLMRYTMGKYPNLPYILLGMSMGSFMVRTILAKYPDSGISGAVLCGTAWKNPMVLFAGRQTCDMICRVTGGKKPDPVLQKLIFGNMNRGIPDAAYDHSWLCRDEDVVQYYESDPLCGAPATASLYRDMLDGIAYIQDPKHLSAMEKGLPVLFLSGDRDPVGDFGAGVRACAEAFRKAGMEQVTVQLYPGARHDILNDTEKEAVWSGLHSWMETAANL